MNNAKIESSDVLTEILIRLPPKSVFRFISVSKGWRDLIKHDPLFLAAYSKLHSRDRPRLLAYILRTFMISRRYRDDEPVMNILSIPGNPKIDELSKRFGYFVTSSGGLILCRSSPHKQYYIINPVTRRWVQLPRASTCSDDHYFRLVGFMCEENTAELRPDYIVVRICDVQHKIKDNIMRIATYSSKSGKWANSDLVATGMIADIVTRYHYCGIPYVGRGVFHWCIDFANTLMVYDPGEKNHLQLIELPQAVGYYSVGHKFIIRRSLSEDTLMCSRMICGGVVKLWRLDKGEHGSYRRATTIPREEWVLVHQVVLAPKSIRGELEGHYDLPSLAGFISCDPIVVLIKIQGTYVTYNLETESGEVVSYRGRFSGEASLTGHLCPFFESSFLSSYAL